MDNLFNDHEEMDEIVIKKIMKEINQMEKSNLNSKEYSSNKMVERIKSVIKEYLKDK